jgi:hypothetical protein
LRICRLRRSRSREELTTARGICPGGPADLPGVIGWAVLTTLLPDRRAILDNVADGYPPIVGVRDNASLLMSAEPRPSRSPVAMPVSA